MENEKAKILIVEDDRDIANTLEIRIGALGLDSIVAHDAAIATKLARDHKPSLVILDIGLPGGDGFEVANRVRRIVGASTPLIFITANARKEIRAKAQDYNPIAFFQKPYHPEELMAAVGSAI
ncbi:MAG: response regulator [Pseudomonadales bacterium]